MHASNVYSLFYYLFKLKILEVTVYTMQAFISMSPTINFHIIIWIVVCLFNPDLIASYGLLNASG